MSCTVSVPDFARQEGVSPDTVRRWIHLGQLDAERIGPRLMRVDPTSLRRHPVGAR